MDDRGQKVRQPTDKPDSLAHLGDCLEASFTADNHDSLGDDITRSLLHLSNETKTTSMRTKLPMLRHP
jgi:hypothetical protein